MVQLQSKLGIFNLFYAKKPISSSLKTAVSGDTGCTYTSYTDICVKKYDYGRPINFLHYSDYLIEFLA